LRFHTAAVRAEQFETQVFASLERLSGSKKGARTAIKQAPTAAVI
jgi:hypothetical protein